MLKKSLVLSFAILLLAVSFVLTGCQDPAAPVVNEGDISFPPQGPTEVTIKNPDNIPELPSGFSYPDAAKVLTGDAADIALAFNGGIFVADTSDADGQSVAAPGNESGYPYAQDGVDQVLWAGPGDRGATGSLNLGAIVVPPGKTLFIGVPLLINGNSGLGQWFTSISVSDMGAVSDGPAASIQASGVGGAPVTGSKALTPGKIVILDGGGITDDTAAGKFTVGGELEIHRGGYINFTGADTPIRTTAGSKAVVYGSITGGAVDLTIDGTFDIKAGGKVETGGGDISFAKAVVLDGELELQGDTVFDGPLTVSQGSTFTKGANAVEFNDKASFSSALAMGTTGNITIGDSGWLSIESAGSLSGSWALVSTSNTGDLFKLRNSIGASEPTDDNARVTIASAASGKKILTLADIRVVNYADLVWYAAQDSITVTNGVNYSSNFYDETATLEITNGNRVNLQTGVTRVGNVTLKADGYLTVVSALTSGKDVKLTGNTGAAIGAGVNLAFTGNPTFATALGNLTIGDDTTPTSITFVAGTLAGAGPDSVITVAKNAVLTLGTTGTARAVNPAGTIILNAGTADVPGGRLSAIGTGGTSPIFGLVKEIKVNDYAVFSTVGSAVTFASLTKLPDMDGTLTADEATTLFADLNTKIGGKTDITGTGTASFAAWNIGTAQKRAFDQLLSIANLGVGSVTGLEKISGFGGVEDADYTATAASGKVLTVNDAATGITVPATGLVIDRNLNLADSAKITTVGASAKITLNANKSISVEGDNVLGGTTQAEALLTTPVAATVFTGTVDSGVPVLTSATGGLTLKAANTLLVPGRLVVGAGNLVAGGGTGTLTLVGTQSPTLENGILGSGAITGTDDSKVTITVNEGGTLTLGTSAVTVTNDTEFLVKKTGKITGGGAKLGSAVITGTIESEDDTSKIASIAPNAATVTGVFSVTNGTFATDTTSSKVVTLTGKIKVANIGNEYDSAELSASVLTGGTAGVSFAATGVISIGTAATVTNGNLFTRGDGYLLIAGTGGTANAVMLQGGTTTSPLALGIFTPAGLTTGTMSLNGGLLTIGTTGFAIGTASTTAALTVGTGTIKYTGNITVSADTTGTSGGKGTLGLNGITIAGIASGTIAALVSPAVTNAIPTPPAPLDLDATQISGQFTQSGTATTGDSSTITLSSNAALITAKGSGVVNIIDSTTKVYSTN
jgi:hypothetical protein